MVRQAVDERAGEAFLSERRGPLVEGRVRRDDGAASFMALADEFEERLRAGLRERREAEFVPSRACEHALPGGG